jgi:putative ATPase
VIAAEDIGLAYPMAIAVTKACVDSAIQLGFPEAQLPLAEAVIMLATAPKSNSSSMAVWSAVEDIEKTDVGDIPPQLKDAHYQGAKQFGHGVLYKYPHDYDNHYTPQQYLPDKIKDKVYYHYGKNKTEQASKLYWDKIKNK